MDENFYKQKDEQKVVLKEVLDILEMLIVEVKKALSELNNVDDREQAIEWAEKYKIIDDYIDRLGELGF